MITMKDAVRLYRAGNNGGHGYSISGETVAKAALVTGRPLLATVTTDDVAVVVDGDDDVIAIGGDAMGRNPWAVCIGSLRDGEFVRSAAIDADL